VLSERWDCALYCVGGEIWVLAKRERGNSANLALGRIAIEEALS